jgi:hypothetical protein
MTWPEIFKMIGLSVVPALSGPRFLCGSSSRDPIADETQDE